MKIQDALAQLRAIAEQLRAEFPDLPADDAAWIDTLDGLTDGLDLAEYLAEHALALQAMEKAAKERAEAMRARAKRFAAEEERLRGVILALVDAAGGKKVVRASLTLSPRAVPPAAVEHDASLTPIQYLRQPPPVPDRKAIKEALSLGAEIPGWSLSNGGRSLSILVK